MLMIFFHRVGVCDCGSSFVLPLSWTTNPQPPPRSHRRCCIWPWTKPQAGRA